MFITGVQVQEHVYERDYMFGAPLTEESGVAEGCIYFFSVERTANLSSDVSRGEESG
jgi:hypothetical protein